MECGIVAIAGLDSKEFHSRSAENFRHFITKGGKYECGVLFCSDCFSACHVIEAIQGGLRRLKGLSEQAVTQVLVFRVQPIDDLLAMFCAFVFPSDLAGKVVKALQNRVLRNFSHPNYRFSLGCRWNIFTEHRDK